jgi:hypothetical protein
MGQTLLDSVEMDRVVNVAEMAPEPTVRRRSVGPTPAGDAPMRAPKYLTPEVALAIGKLLLDRARELVGAPAADPALARATCYGRPQHRFGIDLSGCLQTTTPALAQLVAIRRHLLCHGCDLLLTGLHGQARGVYEVNRLAEALPAV